MRQRPREKRLARLSSAAKITRLGAGLDNAPRKPPAIAEDWATTFRNRRLGRARPGKGPAKSAASVLLYGSVVCIGATPPIQNGLLGEWKHVSEGRGGQGTKSPIPIGCAWRNCWQGEFQEGTVDYHGGAQGDALHG